MTRSRATRRAAFVAVALTAIALMMAAGPGPATAAGKREMYSGLIDLPELEPGVVPHARIEFTVRWKSGRGSSKLVPKLIDPLKERNIYETCNPPLTYPGSGSSGLHIYPTEGNSYNSFVKTYGGPLKVKHRRFSAGYIDTYSDGGSESFSVNGSIPRHGLATGTINLFTHVPASGKRPESNCDSGLLNWSASKK